MGLFSKIFGEGSLPKREKEVEKILNEIRKRTMTTHVRGELTEEETLPWNSKVGGLPYMPREFAYPLDETVERPVMDIGAIMMAARAAAGDPITGGAARVQQMPATGESDGKAGDDEEGQPRERRPLRFLAQVNFAEMPALEGFPREGILQFFISDGDSYGMNFEDGTNQAAFRVIYHEHVTEDASLLLPAIPVTFAGEAADFPVAGERRLRFEPDEMPLVPGDFRFDRLLLEVYNDTHPGATVPTLDRVDDDIIADVYDSLIEPGHRVGGYPLFSQLDPREYNEAMKGHTVLLFQLDTDEHNGIRWGDCGVCNFFIRPEDLAKGDFSDVLYNWDCY